MSLVLLVKCMDMDKIIVNTIITDVSLALTQILWNCQVSLCCCYRCKCVAISVVQLLVLQIQFEQERSEEIREENTHTHNSNANFPKNNCKLADDSHEANDFSFFLWLLFFLLVFKGHWNFFFFLCLLHLSFSFAMTPTAMILIYLEKWCN